MTEYHRLDNLQEEVYGAKFKITWLPLVRFFLLVEPIDEA